MHGVTCWGCGALSLLVLVVGLGVLGLAVYGVCRWLAGRGEGRRG